MENLTQTKKPRLVADFSLDHTGGWGGRIKQNDDWSFHGNKGSNLGYDIMWESVNSDQEEKEGDVLNGNCIINLNNLITNIENKLWWKDSAQEREIKIKLEEEKET